MRHMSVRRIAAAVSLLAVGCLKPSPGGPVGDRSVITRQEIEANHFATLYDVVQGLRLTWMQARGPDSFQPGSSTQVVVYLDDTKLGGVETLRNINLASVMSVKHFDAADATSRWGLGHGAGVIYVSTYPDRRMP